MVKPNKLLLMLLQCTRMICAMVPDDEKIFEAAAGSDILLGQSSHNPWNLDDYHNYGIYTTGSSSGASHWDSTPSYDHHNPKFPLLPYYFVAGLESMCPLNYLVRHSDYTMTGTRPFHEFISQQVVSPSNFAIPFEDPLSHDRVATTSELYSSFLHPCGLYEGFLSRLSRMNLMFLAVLNQHHLDQNVTSELIKTLNWLKSILDSHYNSYSNAYAGSLEAELYSKVAQLVQDQIHLQAPETYKTVSSVSKYEKVDVSKFSAKETRVILTILANYYMSTNKAKWDTIFAGSLEFLKYYMKIAQYSYRHQIQNLHVIHEGFQGGLLPWDQPVEEAVASFKPSEHKMLFDDEKFMVQRMESYVTVDIEERAKLNSYDNEHSTTKKAAKNAAKKITKKPTKKKKEW